MATHTFSAHQGFGGGKPFIARVLGTDPKFGLKREFLPTRKSSSKSGRTSSITASTGVAGLYEVCDTDGRGKSSTYYALLTIGNDLVALRIRHATLIEIVESRRPITDLAPYVDEDGDWTLRRDDKLCWRDEPVAVPVAQPGAAASAPTTAPAVSAATSLRDALSRIEASARWLTEEPGGQGLGADELRAVIAHIRDVAREALGTDA